MVAPNRLTAPQKQTRAIEMRLRGDDFTTIAETLGYADKAAAHNAYTRGMKSFAPDVYADRDLAIRLEAGRLDAIQAAQWSMAMTGDVDAARICLAVMHRRAKMFGFDAPTKTETKVTTELDAEISQMMAQMQKIDAIETVHPGLAEKE